MDACGQSALVVHSLEAGVRRLTKDLRRAVGVELGPACRCRHIVVAVGGGDGVAESGGCCAVSSLRR